MDHVNIYLHQRIASLRLQRFEPDIHRQIAPSYVTNRPQMFEYKVDDIAANGQVDSNATLPNPTRLLVPQLHWAFASACDLGQKLRNIAT